MWSCPPVLRQLTVWVIVGVNLLGMVAPAFACAQNTPGNDCCPMHPASLSHGGQALTPPPECTSASCCASARASSAPTIVDFRLAAHERGYQPSLFPHALSLLGFATSWAVAAPGPGPLTPFVTIRSSQARAGLTYLHTARLRL